MSLIVAEEDVLKTLNDSESKINFDEAQEMISVLKNSISNRAEALEHKTLGAYSFYEGEFNMLHITERMLQKLKLNDRED